MTSGSSPKRARTATIVAVGASLAVVALSLLPWGRSGRVGRSSYRLVNAAERLDVLEGTQRDLARLWYLIPALAAGVWLAALLGRRRLAGTLALAVGVLALTAAVITIRSPLEVQPAAPLAGLAGGLGASAAIVLLTGRKGG
jgi:hypothetical protein